MAIITIAREIGALGEEVAAATAALTGYRLVQKADVEQKLAEYGFDSKKLAKYDERRPGFFASLSQAREDYLHFLKTVILKEAVQGDCILQGRGTFALLGSVPGILNAKIIAPRHVRIDRIKGYYKCDDRRAEQILSSSDRDRQGYSSYFFGMSWKDAESYDLVVNTFEMDAPSAAQIVVAASKALEAKVDPALTRKRLEDLAKGHDVVTTILYEHRVPIQFLEADCQGQVVTLHGVASSRSAIEAALAAARSLRGVSEVVSEIQVVQEYSALP